MDAPRACKIATLGTNQKKNKIMIPDVVNYYQKKKKTKQSIESIWGKEKTFEQWQSTLMALLEDKFQFNRLWNSGT